MAHVAHKNLMRDTVGAFWVERAEIADLRRQEDEEIRFGYSWQ